MSSWLSLTVSEPAARHRSRTPFVISISKKVERLATRRNRLKRLIREAVRRVPFFESAGRVYHFRVRSMPRELTLASVMNAVEKSAKKAE